MRGSTNCGIPIFHPIRITAHYPLEIRPFKLKYGKHVKFIGITGENLPYPRPSATG
ncbi:hypothetical protein BABINDRAFT_162398 [Babjeviella inositovora NRRL Y-12698]|uniref:Uncharacterized protein n=1 Tax=Babjeviella inositovora NRRL Y-12698 TaxID=984486 RepID=A0A1E3QM53_9ASCO|nr:uncharacterized protein BABINDRAFT_162398 [Babjeviella inositovora NRRL Y-12698]ODQ78698.1 hypothetical protein BABINDRAFT_162398 [Babjeviella inositovora NRRL Y-12698]